MKFLFKCILTIEIILDDINHDEKSITHELIFVMNMECEPVVESIY